MEKPDNEDIIIQIEETLHLFLWPNNITTFFLFQSCFIYHVLLFVDDVVTSWPQTKISDWSDKNVSRFLLYRIPEHVLSQSVYHATFCIMILVSLHTKLSSTFHAVCLQIELAKMENPDNEDIIIQIEETLHLFLWSNNITTFSPFQSCFIYHVLLFVDDVVTSWTQTKISDWSEIKCIVILKVQNRTCSIPKCVSCKSCMIQSNSTVYTVFFSLWYKYHDTCFTV